MTEEFDESLKHSMKVKTQERFNNGKVREYTEDESFMLLCVQFINRVREICPNKGISNIVRLCSSLWDAPHKRKQICENPEFKGFYSYHSKVSNSENSREKQTRNKQEKPIDESVLIQQWMKTFGISEETAKQMLKDAKGI